MTVQGSVPSQQSSSAPKPPTLKLYLVDVATGAEVQGPVPWLPFYEALRLLCEQVGNIEIECESAEDESLALFWQPSGSERWASRGFQATACSST